MEWVHLLSWFFGGAFLANAIPHWVSGLMGRAFQSPFATPHGEGLSSSTVNVVWGFANLIVAYVLVLQVGDFDLKNAVDAFAVGLGILVLSVPTARHFGRFNGGRLPKKS